jgi:hypothetical protein
MHAPSREFLIALAKASEEAPRSVDEKTLQERRSASLAYYEKTFGADKAAMLNRLYGPKTQ